MQILLSVIIPVYKVEQYIEQCLDSIVNGISDAVEVIVVDDGSPDKSGSIADDYAQKYPCIKVIHKKNAGVAAARNTGIDAAQGEWLYFVDSDDWLVDGAVQKICTLCRENPKTDVIMMDAWQVSGDKKNAWEHFEHDMCWKDRQSIRRLQNGMLYFPSVDKQMKVPLAAPWDKVYRKEFLLKNELCYPENLKVLDDMVFNVQVFGCADSVLYRKEKVYNYRYVPDSITNDYKPDRVKQDCQVWDFLSKYFEKLLHLQCWSETEEKALEQVFYCRIIKSFSICCRLCFFNEKNKKSLLQKLQYVRQVMGEEPYAGAFQNVKLNNAEWKLKLVIQMARCRCGIGIYLLHLMQNLLR